MNKQKLNTLIAKGKTKAVLNHLLQIKSSLDEDLQEQITLVSAQYETLTKVKRIGVLAQEDKDITLNRVNEALMGIVSELPENVINLGKNRGSFSLDSQMVKWIVGVVAILILVWIVVEKAGWNINVEGDNSPPVIINGDNNPVNHSWQDAVNDDSTNYERKE